MAFVPSLLETILIIFMVLLDGEDLEADWQIKLLDMLELFTMLQPFAHGVISAHLPLARNDSLQTSLPPTAAYQHASDWTDAAAVV